MTFFVDRGAIDTIGLSLFSVLTEERITIIVLIVFGVLCNDYRAQFVRGLRQRVRLVLFNGLLYSWHQVSPAVLLANPVPCRDKTLFHLFKATLQSFLDDVTLE